MTGEFWSVVVFFLALIPWCAYLMVGTSFVLSIIYSHCYLYRDTEAPCYSNTPGISVIKPLMGVDNYLQENLESHFTLSYPKFEILFCVHTPDDPAIEVVRKLQQKFPNVNCRLFIGGKNGIINPLVNNMAPAYDASAYDVIWVSTSRVKVRTEILLDMVGKLSHPNVALVHQMPFVADQKGLPAAVERVCFGCSLARYYLAFNLVGASCFTGMSYLVKKSELDKINGLSYYGRYLAEDFFFAKSLHSKGFSHRVATYPAIQQVATTSFASYRERMVRWSRLRINMMPVVSGVFEPLAESIALGIYMAWSMYHLYAINPLIWFTCHMIVWCTLDYIQLSAVQRGSHYLKKSEFLMAWILRELLVIVIYIEALWNVRHIRWGRTIFRLSNCGRTLEKIYDPVALPL